MKQFSLRAISSAPAAIRRYDRRQYGAIDRAGKGSDNDNYRKEASNKTPSLLRDQTFLEVLSSVNRVFDPDVTSIMEYIGGKHTPLGDLTPAFDLTIRVRHPPQLMDIEKHPRQH